MKETQNINDLWVCEKCGRFSYYKSFAHATRISKMDFCDGKKYKFKTWLKRRLVKEQEKE